MAGLSMLDVLVEPAFGEQNFGVLHGVRQVEHEATRTDVFRGLWPAPPDLVPLGGESFIDVIDRVAAAMERISMAHRGRDVICIAHSGPIRAAIAVALGLSPGHALTFSIEPLSLTRLHRLHDSADGTPGWRLFGINECC
jgi:alpha-ribazole phosphatase